MNNIANLWPAWLAVSIASLVMLNQAITESERFANMLGRFGRAMYARSKRRYQMDQIEFSTAVRNAVNDERKRWEEEETRALTVVEGQMKYVTETAKDQQKVLSELNFKIRCMTAYVEYEADWHHKLRMQLLSTANSPSGIVNVDDLPPHLDFAQFEKNCHQKGDMNWRSWLP